MNPKQKAYVNSDDNLVSKESTTTGSIPDSNYVFQLVEGFEDNPRNTFSQYSENMTSGIGKQWGDYIPPKFY